MRKILFTLMTAFLSFIGLSAQVDFKEVVLNGDEPAVVEVKMGVNYFILTAPQTGTLGFHVGWSSAMIYTTDANGSEESKTILSRSGDDNGVIYLATVEEGQVYYFCTSLIVDPGTITIGYSMEDNSIKMSSNYEDGALFNMNGRNLELTFDRPVAIGSTRVAYGNGQEEDVPSSCINSIFVTEYYYTIILRDLVEYLMDGGKIEVGDKFTINLYDIKDAADPNNIYGEDGTYSITFELGMMPATLLSVTPADGSQIYTYYPEDGTDGFIVFTFSEPLDESKDGVTVILSWGDKEAGSYEEYHPDFTIEGATVTVDIRGIMIPAEVDSGRGMSGATKVSLSLSGLTTVDGRAVDPNYPSAGTSAILAFFDVKKQEIDFIYDFIPQDGNASLEGYDEIVIWLSNPIMYDGVTVTWQDVRGGEHSRTYIPEEIPFAWDDYEEGYTAHISLGTISYNTRPVTVNVDNARLMNGDAVTIYGEFNTDAGKGIEGIIASDPDRVVKAYGVDGVLVKEDKACNVLDGLEKGVYIIDGVKVFVK